MMVGPMVCRCEGSERMCELEGRVAVLPVE